MKKLYYLIILFIFSTIIFTGCASVPMSSLDNDLLGKRFLAQNNKSNIYLYRNESMGGAVLLTISLDGKVAGQTAAQTYFLWEVDPGNHEVSSLAENVSTLNLATSPGKSYFIWQEIKMGMWTARSLLQEVDRETGEQAVNECKRAQSNF